MLWVDLSPPEGDVHVVKAIVPGLEAETATYARIGLRNLAQLLGASWASSATVPPPGAAPIRLPEGEPPAWLHLERIDALVGERYALHREPDRHATAVLLERCGRNAGA